MSRDSTYKSARRVEEIASFICETTMTPVIKKVLVAESIKKVIGEGSTLFSRAHFKFLVASSCEEMLKIHRRETPDLVIADFDMDEMGGDELCAAIRANEQTRKVSIIISCPDDRMAVEKCEACGANAVIVKPIRPEELFDKVVHLLNIHERRGLREVTKVSVDGRTRSGFFFAVSLNISASGMLLETDKVLHQGDLITCSFVLQHKITAEAEVARVSEEALNLYHYGVRFLSLDPESRRQIEELAESSGYITGVEKKQKK